MTQSIENWMSGWPRVRTLYKYEVMDIFLAPCHWEDRYRWAMFSNIADKSRLFMKTMFCYKVQKLYFALRSHKYSCLIKGFEE